MFAFEIADWRLNTNKVSKYRPCCITSCSISNQPMQSNTNLFQSCGQQVHPTPELGVPRPRHRILLQPNQWTWQCDQQKLQCLRQRRKHGSRATSINSPGKPTNTYWPKSRLRVLQMPSALQVNLHTRLIDHKEQWCNFEKFACVWTTIPLVIIGQPKPSVPHLWPNPQPHDSHSANSPGPFDY